MLPSRDFWVGKRVLLTGHTGFKGAWLSVWLQQLGAQVTGIALPPATQPSLFSLLGRLPGMDSHTCDIRDAAALQAVVVAAQPDVVLHLAAQALVRAGYAQPQATFATNVMGTVNLLEALRSVDSVRTVVAVTTDKVYLNREWTYPYREEDALGGHDPYSASKAACEMVVASYRDSFLRARGVGLAAARAGNVIGGGDWSADRLIPDAVRAWSTGQALEVRRPSAVRPWQHVLEPLAAYLVLAQRLWQAPELAGAYNFGPETGEAATVGEVVRMAQACHGNADVLWGDDTQGPHEAGLLGLEIAKAKALLDVRPRWNLRTAVERTMQWYGRQAQGAAALELCTADIGDYEAGR